ncbi:aldo/keto reductase [Gluconobacter roseus]|uniref:Oxidoreductase n=1 Tax=Gluconobacter roseus NBRC 3990 TaxID=1307950 RepID=A0A4Y3MA72_9PROT|nr:aldo/keto reductase [Gluconobacter roseus]KXV43738.1 pyridoxal 4-dehydrogenase [Gluconobacter roseus]GBR46134.1 putative oxidoreductase [Gluconobacter roseus NBRC 3990]GEB03219.1 oxidoreductase [Gluconobacter roseus NBRC 3990]GLP93677.1 oxidoreductase [Gluconobacter roseus NBRC 3990]
MKPTEKRTFGRSGVDVTAFAFGTAPLGNFLHEVGEDAAQTMINHAWDSGIRLFDTAPMYGHGLAELRLGHALRWKNRDDYALTSKVGRVLHPAPRASIDFAPWNNAAANTMAFDYSYDGTMRAFEDSLQRLALERIDFVFIHDIDRFTHGDAQPEHFRAAMNGSWRALEKLRSEGVVKGIGVGVNEWQVCHEALQQRDFDCFLLAGRYTLLEQDSLESFLPLCEERGVSLLVGGGFNSGILATGAVPGAKYNYTPAPAEILERVSRIEAVCREYNVPLPAAALQFVVAHPAIKAFCAGTRTVDQLEQNLGWFSHPIPPEFWEALKQRGLLAENAPVPSGLAEKELEPN